MSSQATIQNGVKHLQVADWLREGIADGRFAPGSALESESRLCRRFGVSRGPVRQALKLLENENLIYRAPGKGSFVREKLPAAVSPALRQINVLIDTSTGSLDDNFVVLEIIEGLNRAAAQLDQPYKLSYQFHHFGDDPAAGADGGLSAFTTHSQGLLVIPFTRRGTELLRRIRSLSVPLVSFFDRVDNPTVSQVYLDHEAGARRATELLLQFGHRRTALLIPSLTPCKPSLNQRLAGYRRAIEADGQAAMMTVETGEGSASVHQAALNMLDRVDRPTAVLIAGGLLTAPVMQAVRDRGLTVPGDLSVIAADDTSEAQMHHRALTVIKQPLIQGIGQALQMLLARIKGRQHHAQSLALEPELVIRGSCAPLLCASDESELPASVLAQ